MRKIQKTICREELKSRIPGLFAYIEENDAGEFELHKATDSLQGCYGKIIENIKLPTPTDGNSDVLPINLKINDEYILEEGKTYPYRTLMNYYYEYKNYEFTDDDDDSFISFIDTAIGKIEIDFNSLGLNESDNDLVPHYIYLANARKLFNQYSKLKIVYDYYTGGYIEADGKLVPNEFDINVLEGDICCLCTKYVRMGGTVIYEKLSELISEAEDIANDYYHYAINEEDKYVEGEKYAKTDFCDENEDNRIKFYNSLTLKLDIVLSQSIHDIGYLSCYLNDWVGGDKHYAGELYTYNGNTYVCMVDNYDVYDKETMRFLFDDVTNFKKMSDVTTWPKPLQPNGESIRDENITICNPYGSKFTFYNDDGSIIEGKNDYEILSITKDGEKNPSSDSKLKSLRRYKQYINGQDKEEYPNDNEDWLYFYKKNKVINYTTKNDELGNLYLLSSDWYNLINIKDNEPSEGQYVNNLCAFGDLITDIKRDVSKKIITFKYVFNAHLKAKLLKKETDDDGNKIFLFGEFELDDTENVNKYNIKFMEEYNYEENGDIDNMSDEEFEKYINDDNPVDFNKYPFSLIDSTLYYDKRLDTQIVSIPYIKSEYDALIKNETDYLFSDIYKTDYLGGITYKPKVENDVRIERGNYMAFERHLKLAEIKTMEDMENYSNNSFFNVQKVS